MARILELIGGEDNDVQYLEIAGRLVALKMDGAALSHYMLPIHDMYDVGWRAAIGALSDLYAKFVRPLAVLASISVPVDRAADAVHIARGIAGAAAYNGARYLGGDLNESVGDAVIDVAAFGLAPRKIPRKAPPGTTLVTLPVFGLTGMAFRHLSGGPKTDAAVRGIAMLKRPVLDWSLLDHIPLNCVKASMDSSDGLADVLWAMVGRDTDIIVRGLPTPSDVGPIDEDAVFNGGEEYVPVLAVSPTCVGYLREVGLVDFADVVEGGGTVYYNGRALPYRGWKYFGGASHHPPRYSR